MAPLPLKRSLKIISFPPHPATPNKQTHTSHYSGAQPSHHRKKYFCLFWLLREGRGRAVSEKKLEIRGPSRVSGDCGIRPRPTVEFPNFFSFSERQIPGKFDARISKSTHSERGFGNSTAVSHHHVALHNTLRTPFPLLSSWHFSVIFFITDAQQSE